MVDRIEREIEEILAKLDDPGRPSAGGSATETKKPIPIQSRRKKGPSTVSRIRASIGSSLPDVNPATLLFAGAGMLLAGLVLSVIASALIWVAFAGILVFLGAFVWSFLRTPGSPKSGSAPSGHYWRDRYISYEQPQRGPVDKIKRKFRR